jgi:hypothetical protein
MGVVWGLATTAGLVFELLHDFWLVTGKRYCT